MYVLSFYLNIHTIQQYQKNNSYQIIKFIQYIHIQNNSNSNNITHPIPNSMKKQNPQSYPRQKISDITNNNNKSNNNNRATPPFLQFQTIRQRLRIAIPNQQNKNNKLIGFKDMEQINKNRQNCVDFNQNYNDDDDSLLNFSQRKFQYKSKSKEKQDQQKLKKKFKECIKQAEKLVNKIKNNQKRQKNMKQCKRQNKKQKIVNQSKNFNKNKANRDKNNTKQKLSYKKSSKHEKDLDIFDQIKFSQQRSRGKSIGYYDISQYLHPKTQDLKGIYHLHNNREKNTRSYNMQEKNKILTHKRQRSQCLKKLNHSKQLIQKKIHPNQIKYHMKLRNNELIHKVCANSLDSSLTYNRQHTDYDIEQYPDNSIPLSNKQKQWLQNSRILQQLYSSSQQNTNQKNDIIIDVDSEDECLLTMMSLDIEHLKSQIKQRMRISRNIDNDQGNDNKRIKQENLQQKNQNQKIGIKYAKQQQPSTNVQIQATNNSNQLINKIQSILTQINKIKDINRQQKLQIQPLQQQSNQISQQNSQNPSDSPNISASSPKSWSFGPTLIQLQIMLQKCLKNEHQSLQKSRIIQKKHKIQQNKHIFLQKNRTIYIEQKWKLNQIKQIKKAQKLLKIGYIQANKLLTNKIQLTNIQKNDKKYKKQVKNKIKYHSMLNLHLMQHKKQKQKQFQISQQQQNINNNKFNYQQLHIKNTIDIQNIQFDDNDEDSIMQSIILSKNKQSKQIHDEPQPQHPQSYYTKNNTQNYLQIQNQLFHEEISHILRKTKNKQKILQDIIQLILLQLCIEIIEDIQIYFTLPQQLYEILYQNIYKIKNKKCKLGFYTNPSQIYGILQKFGKFLEKQTINQLTYKNIIYERIKKPIGPKPLQLLKFMRQASDDQLLHPQQQQQQQQQLLQKQTFALSLQWFHQFSSHYIEAYNFGNYYIKQQQKQKENKRKIFLKNAMHIHNKSIFDSINQIIDKYRPFGLIGQPFPWKPRSIPSPISIKQFHTILNKTFEEVADNCRYLCGMFPEEHITYKLSQEQFLQFSQDRLNKLLKKYVADNQQRWDFIDDQQTEILIQIGRFIFVSLVKEVAQQIYFIGGIDQTI